MIRMWLDIEVINLMQNCLFKAGAGGVPFDPWIMSLVAGDVSEVSYDTFGRKQYNDIYRKGRSDHPSYGHPPHFFWSQGHQMVLWSSDIEVNRMIASEPSLAPLPLLSLLLVRVDGSSSKRDDPS